MSEPVKSSPSLRPFDFALLIGVIISLALSIFAGMRPMKSTTGTWVCQDARGGQVAIANPANCGPDDLVLWCEVWKESADGSGGKCVG